MTALWVIVLCGVLSIVYAIWATSSVLGADAGNARMQEIANCPNVTVKLGGLAMSFAGMPDHGPAAGLSSEVLAAMWRPYIETCIEAFGAKRGMLESNFPPDSASCSYANLWNGFKRITQGASAEEKASLYRTTARDFYRLD